MKEIKKTVEKLGEGIVKSIKENMSSYGQGDSNLAKSLRYEANEEKLVVYAADYWDYAEKGRGPGGVPRNFIEILDSWVSRHKVSFDGDKRVFLQNVKWSIIRYGTRMWRNGETRDFMKDAFEKNLETFESEISKTLIEDIKETIKE